jgi:hypothetical protein
MIVVKRAHNWSVRPAVHGDLGSRFTDAACFLIFDCMFNVRMASTWRPKPASSGSSQKLVYRMGTPLGLRSPLTTRLPSHPMVFAAPTSYCHCKFCVTEF